MRRIRPGMRACGAPWRLCLQTSVPLIVFKENDCRAIGILIQRIQGRVIHNYLRLGLFSQSYGNHRHTL